MKKVTQKELRDACESVSYSLGTWKGRHRSDNHDLTIRHIGASLAPLVALLERPMRKTVRCEESARALVEQARRAMGEHKGSRVTRVNGGDVESSCHLSSSKQLPDGGFMVRFRPFGGPPSRCEFFSPDRKEDAAEYHDHLATGLR